MHLDHFPGQFFLHEYLLVCRDMESKWFFLMQSSSLTHLSEFWSLQTWYWLFDSATGMITIVTGEPGITSAVAVDCKCFFQYHYNWASKLGQRRIWDVLESPTMLVILELKSTVWDLPWEGQLVTGMYQSTPQSSKHIRNVVWKHLQWQ